LQRLELFDYRCILILDGGGDVLFRPDHIAEGREGKQDPVDKAVFPAALIGQFSEHFWGETAGDCHKGVIDGDRLFPALAVNQDGRAIPKTQPRLPIIAFTSFVLVHRTCPSRKLITDEQHPAGILLQDPCQRLGRRICAEELLEFRFVRLCGDSVGHRTLLPLPGSIAFVVRCPLKFIGAHVLGIGLLEAVLGPIQRPQHQV